MIAILYDKLRSASEMWHKMGNVVKENVTCTTNGHNQVYRHGQQSNDNGGFLHHDEPHIFKLPTENVKICVRKGHQIGDPYYLLTVVFPQRAHSHFITKKQSVSALKKQCNNLFHQIMCQ